RSMARRTEDEAQSIPPRGEGGRGRPSTTLPVALPRRLRKQLTPQEVKLWNWLREGFRPLGYHFRRQVPIGRYVADFACVRRLVVVEADGGGHGSHAGRAADSSRDAFLEGQGFRVVRFWNHEIDRDKAMFMDTILAALEGRR
ncbi:MAG: endonuclease domain-containing protein, partial [Beijerinckiaceae bacterium]